MAEVEQTTGARRLILGFDAGCTTCSELAKRIEKAVGGKLEVRSLRDPEMEKWRKQALGSDAPWTPTLVEVQDGKVKAWTRMNMGVSLARMLGPTDTWRLLRIIGEIRKKSEILQPSHSSLSRSQFLKGLGGTFVGISLLSGTGSLPAAAASDKHWISQLSISSRQELSRKQAMVAWLRLTRGRHLRGFLASSAVGENPLARRIINSMLSEVRSATTNKSAAIVKGIRHQLDDGGQLLALVYQEGDVLIVSYRLDKNQETRLFSQVLKSRFTEDQSEDTIEILARAEDMDIFAPSRSISARRTCSSERQCPGSCYTCQCASYSGRCLFNCCAACALCRWGPTAGCIACILVYCPICATVNNCCSYRACNYRPSCG